MAGEVAAFAGVVDVGLVLSRSGNGGVEGVCADSLEFDGKSETWRAGMRTSM